MKRIIKDEYGKKMVRLTMTNNMPLTDEQIEMIDKAANIPYEYDEDCPPMDDELLAEMDRDIENLIVKNGGIPAAS